MKIGINQLSKVYNHKTLFKDLALEVATGSKVAIIGENGSGKSTLLKIIAGLEAQTLGTVLYNDQLDIVNSAYSYTAPYISPIEDFSTIENLEFAAKFKPFREGLSITEVFNILPENKRHPKKPLKALSSGMIQRVKILIAIMTDVNLVLLDEPASNLDEEGIDWYLQLVAQYLNKATVFVASNNQIEYNFCSSYIQMGELPLRHGSIKDLP